MLPVLRVLLAQRSDDGGVLRGIVGGFQERRRAVESQPTESPPVLVPVVDEESNQRPLGNVPNALEVMHVRHPFRLFVEGCVEDAIRDNEADRNLPRLTIRGDRREDCRSG